MTNQRGGLERSAASPSPLNGRRAARRRRELLRRRRQRALVGLIAVIALVVVATWQLTKSHPSASAASTSTSATKPPSSAPPASKPAATQTAYVPPRVRPVVLPVQAGDGVWKVKGAWHKGAPAVMEAAFHPFVAAPTITAYASWIRTASTQTDLYLGYKGPGATNLNRGPEMIPTAKRGGLLAAFNSGFYEADSPAGFYTHHTTYFPMIKGLATLVQYTNGTVDLFNWTGGPTPPANVAMARQNLHLLVKNGAVTPNATNPSIWGLTLYGAPAVWRTGICLDRKGNLIYAAAPQQTALSLAQVFVRLGCTSAMQLDINPAWPIFVTYGGPGALAPSFDVPNPNQVPFRFLYSSTKDFFAVYARNGGAVQPPW